MSEVRRQKSEGYVEKIMAEATNWLQVVDHEHRTISRIDTPYNQAREQVLGYLQERMAEGDVPTAELLATFEQQAQQATSEFGWFSDVDAQNTYRTVTFDHFAQAMNRYAGRPYNN